MQHTILFLSATINSHQNIVLGVEEAAVGKGQDHCISPACIHSVTPAAVAAVTDGQQAIQHVDHIILLNYCIVTD